MAGADDGSKKIRRTWPQRLLVAGALLGALGAFTGAGAIWYVQQQLEERDLVSIDDGSAALGQFDNVNQGALGANTGDGNAGSEGDAPLIPSADINGGASSENPNEPVETFPPAEPEARNILITGADNNSCLDPESPYAAAFGDRTGFGERSDTIMMWRVNPATSQVAVLSFPRDLWVTIAGRSNKQRINTAYERNEPQRLIDTIAENFGILTDHFIQVDFCAFKTLVDAVDGVAVPFERSIRDVNTGLNVEIEGPQCFTFTGDHALAYVRSRKLQVIDENGDWKSADGFSDLSRISRQQDFIRRVLDEAIANAFSPSVVRSLLTTSKDFIVTDTELTPNKVLQFSGVLRSIDPAGITTYQIEASNDTIQGNAVLVPRLDGDNMQAVLRLFRGEATLAEQPVQVFDEPASTEGAPLTTVPLTTVPLTTAPLTTVPLTTAPATTEPAVTVPEPTDAVTVPTGTAELVPVDTVPVVEAEDIIKGLVPDSSIRCT